MLLAYVTTKSLLPIFFKIYHIFKNCHNFFCPKWIFEDFGYFVSDYVLMFVAKIQLCGIFFRVKTQFYWTNGDVINKKKLQTVVT